jgi:hypothetical protein
MTQKKRLTYALLIALAIAVVGVLLMPHVLQWRAAKAFDRIAQGDAETKVVMYLGYPDSTRNCATQLQWGADSLGANDGRCVREVRYWSHGGSWVVGYGADRHVISKYFEPAGQVQP